MSILSLFLTQHRRRAAGRCTFHARYNLLGATRPVPRAFPPRHFGATLPAYPDGAAAELSAPLQHSFRCAQVFERGQMRLSIFNLSVKTVDTHRAQIMERLAVRDLAGLVMYALRRGIIKLDE